MERKNMNLEFKVGLNTDQFEKSAQKAVIAVHRLGEALNKLETPLKKLTDALGDLKDIKIEMTIDQEPKKWWQIWKR